MLLFLPYFYIIQQQYLASYHLCDVTAREKYQRIRAMFVNATERVNIWRKHPRQHRRVPRRVAAERSIM